MAAAPPRRLPKLVLFTALILAVLAGFAGATVSLPDYRDLAIAYSLAVTAMWLIVLAAEVLVNGGSLLSVKTLFYTALCYFHSAGTTVKFVELTTPAAYAAPGFLVTATAIASAGLGIVWCRSAPVAKLRPLHWPTRVILLAIAILHLAGWVAFLIFIHYWGFERFLFGYGPYSGLEIQEQAGMVVHFRVLAWTLWTVSLWLLAMQWMETRRRAVFVGLIAATIPMLLLLIAGYRGQAIRMLAGLLLIRHLRRRFSLKTIVAMALVLLFIIGLIGIIRGAGEPGGVLAQLAQRAPAFALFLASPGSLTRIVAATVERVGVVEDYALGREYATQIVGKLIPAFGWKIAPWATLRNLRPGVWASYHCWRAFRPGVRVEMVGSTLPGLGFSMIAEAYLNFGWAGIIVIPFLFAALASWLDRTLARSDALTEVLLLQLSVNLLMATRGAVEQLLDSVTVVAIIIILLRLVGDAVSREARAIVGARLAASSLPKTKSTPHS